MAFPLLTLAGDSIKVQIESNIQAHHHHAIMPRRCERGRLVTWDAHCSDMREAPIYEKCCSNGILPNSVSTPPLKQTDALWELFLPKIGKFVKTAVLTLGIDILTMTMVKLCS